MSQIEQASPHDTVYAQGQAFTIGRDLDELRESDPTAAIADLRERLEDDGYLLLRGFHPRDEVVAARRDVTAALAAAGRLRPGTDPLDAIAADDAAGLGVNDWPLDGMPAYRELVDGRRRLDFFDRLLGGESMTLDHKWLRTVPPGAKGTPSHYDIVFMGEGTRRLMTMWTPLGDIDYTMGPLMLLPGSHRCREVVESYGRTNTHLGTPSSFSLDPKRAGEVTGCRWASTTFAAGDLLLFGMFTMHASLENRSDRFRISTDNRYQLADEPVDQRHMGMLDVHPTPGDWLATHGHELRT